MEIKENKGYVFKNEYKKEGDSQPNYKGNCMVNGKEMEIGMWINKDKNDKSYFSVSFSEPYVKEESKSEDKKEDTDLPF